jgi:hypothetical protein
MADVAPHDVAVYVQDELLPGVMGEVQRNAPDFNVMMTVNHLANRHLLINNRIRAFYDLQPGDVARPTEIYDNLIKYEIYHRVGPGDYQVIVRPRRAAGGKRRSTRKAKRRATRRLKSKRIYYSTL